MKRKQFYLTEKQIALLESIARKSGLSVAELLRRIIDEYLKEKGL
jgi:hypothetical protein